MDLTGTPPPTAADQPLIIFITVQGLGDKLLSLHVDDGTGHCATCSAGGQTGHYRWPCQIHDNALAARSLHPSRDKKIP